MPRTAFRPCIDLHSGQVKQIVGGSLNDKDESQLKTNFVSRLVSRTLTAGHKQRRHPRSDLTNTPTTLYHSEPPNYYAKLYRDNELTGAHVIKLGPGNDEAAKECLRAWPGK